MYGESLSALVKCHPPMHHGALTWDTVWYLSSSALARALLTQSRDFFFFWWSHCSGLCLEASVWMRGVALSFGILPARCLLEAVRPGGGFGPARWGCSCTAARVGEFRVSPLLCTISACVLLG